MLVKATNEYFRIKDNCRKGLLKHLEAACVKLPQLTNPNILDVGCGTGVPTLWLAERFSANITAIDMNREAIMYLQQKIGEKNLLNRIQAHCTSLSDYICESEFFDIIMGEGFLNVVGFESGCKRMAEMLKKKGYLIIHDEYKDHHEKLTFITENNFTIIQTLYLDENVWWNDYYKQLEIEIGRVDASAISELCRKDMEEIKYYKANSSLFRSIYYIVMKM